MSDEDVAKTLKKRGSESKVRMDALPLVKINNMNVDFSFITGRKGYKD